MLDPILSFESYIGIPLLPVYCRWSMLDSRYICWC